MTNLYLQSISLFYMMIIIILFFGKQRVNTPETRIFTYMSLVNILGIVLDIVIVYLSYKVPFHDSLYILNKLYLAYILIWAVMFFLYIAYISFQKREKIYLILRRLATVFSLISLSAIFYLPINLFNENNIMYTYGDSVSVLFGSVVVIVVFIIMAFFSNYKNLITKKYIPIYTFIFASIFAIIVRSISPEVLLTTAILTFINVLMYFTIENPDLKVINELNISKNRAEKANMAKTDFLSSMSHEIRTPLNAIVGFSEAIKSEEDIEACKEDAKDIVSASKNLLEIVNGILNISKIEANKMEIVNKEYSPRKIFKDSVKLIKPRLDEKGLKINVKFATDLPGVLYGDSGKIKEILLNLLTNAIKYTEDGEVRFEVNCVNDKNTSNLVISIEDTGRGIKKEMISRLFMKFNRLDEDKNTTLEGTGLGLAITKSFVEMMGGKIVVQSKYGKGSSFTVYLSQKVISMEEIIQVENTVHIQIDKEMLKNKTVLVVDDNKLNIKVAEKMLKPYGMIVKSCMSGFECIDLIREKGEYDLILMDDMMPKMSGVETFDSLKSELNYKKPIVALTANALEGVREKYLEQGFSDYLAKPIIKDELVRVIENYLVSEPSDAQN